MPGPRVPVIVRGNAIPTEGAFFPAYKTALRELGIARSSGQRDSDRRELKAKGSIFINGYTIVMAP